MGRFLGRSAGSLAGFERLTAKTNVEKDIPEILGFNFGDFVPGSNCF